MINNQQSASQINAQQNQVKQDQENDQTSFFSLFRFATTHDVLLMVAGTICAGAMGTVLPLFSLLWGDMTNSFGKGEQIVESARQVMYNFIEIGIGAFFAGWGMFAFWSITGERQGIACRKKYLKSLLRQEISWFDTINQSELATKFASDSFAFRQAIGEKVSTFLMSISMFISAVAIAFSRGWLMTLVTIATVPAIVFGAYLYSIAAAKEESELVNDYAEAGGKAEEAISSIKTVKQLNGEKFEADNYADRLINVTKNSTKYGMLVGIGLGSLIAMILFSYSLGFWFGSNCVEGSSKCPPSMNGGKAYSAGDVMVIFFGIFQTGYCFIQLTPALKKISIGKVAAARIFKIIDRQPLIKSTQNAVTPNNFRGIFRFEDVSFAYPKNPTKTILKNLTLEISAKSTAFVGESGCGKSTIFQLMMRFYDPDEGRITLDGVDLRDLNIYWLRNQIGYVGQEPVMFSTTIRENMLFGEEEATQQQIDNALRKAEVFDFVYSLKEKLETFVGTAGSQISGGQKQRLAIARAILKNPRILLLDEATSALDRKNEKNIQSTLNKIAEETMTVTIAHRVNTIMRCDEIYVLNKGKILEKGKFSELQRYKEVKLSEEHIQIESTNKINKEQQEPLSAVTIKLTDTKAEIYFEKKDEDLSEEERQKKRAEQLLKKYEDSIFGRLYSYSSGRKGLIALGTLASICNGVIFPVFSIFLAKLIAILLNFNDNPSQARSDANLYSIVFLILGICTFFFNVIQQAIFSTIGSEITQKLRNESFLKILKMPIVWFDKPRNSSGTLATRLATDCKVVNGLTTNYSGLFIQNAATLISGLLISFLYEWRTSLVSAGLNPLIIAAGVMKAWVSSLYSSKSDEAFKESSNLITQSMINIRTVTSFCSEEMILEKYSSMLMQTYKLGLKKGIIAGVFYGLAQLIMDIIFALIFFLGAVFLYNHNLEISDVFTAIYANYYTGLTIGNYSQFMPDAMNAKNAAANIFELLDSEDEDQLQIKEGSNILSMPIRGNIVFKNISFKYQSRDEYVFKDLNLEIKEGWKVGLVGPSGCGKSTIHQLLQRFYDAERGEILIDGVNIKEYDIHHLRRSFGVVSQQPVLFNESIGYNIKYNKQDVTMEDIRNAANQSNFNPEVQRDMGFIATQPQKMIGYNNEENKTSVKTSKEDGFNKNVGVKGSHISGGQKQRVAIARVVIRKPNLLLLDEATSALDSINEKKVQESLDRMMENKTCINIAHRIDTIKNSNVILVFEKGEIVEKGTYDELMELRGYFYKLQKGIETV